MRSTALTQFQRLEAAGSWRPAPGEKLREVIVSIGEATLILSDPKSDAPLTHWSLPAVERLNPSVTPAIYTPAAADAGPATMPLTEADPFRTQPYPAILSERDWVTLQPICIDRG